MSALGAVDGGQRNVVKRIIAVGRQTVDNRNNSADARAHGPVPISAVMV